MLAELSLTDSSWVLTANPYVLHRAGQAIPGSRQIHDGRIAYPRTDDVAAELMWFRRRFAFQCDDKSEGELRTAAARSSMRELSARKVIAGKFDRSRINFREGRTPRDYQVMAAKLLRAVEGYVLADELGLGKTVEAAAAIADPSMYPAVVIAPANLGYQWKEQLEYFIDDCAVHLINRMDPYDLLICWRCQACGKQVEPRNVALKHCPSCGGHKMVRCYPDVTVCSYRKAYAWRYKLAGMVKSVVFDEAQELRLDTSEKYRGCLHIAHASKYRLAMSAKPIHNYGGEIYNIVNVVAPMRLGSKSDFQMQWCTYNESNGSEPALDDPQACGQYLISQHLMLRRTRADVGRELPQEQRVIHPVEVDLDRFRRESATATPLARTIVSGREGPGSLKTFDKLMWQATGIAKAEAVAGFVELLLESGEPIVLFGYHRAVYEQWCRFLKRFNPLMYTGSESASKKHENKQRFLAGESNLLIASLKSGAGLDGLQQRVKVGAFGEFDWSPSVIDQCVGRYHRDGQKNACLSYYLPSTCGIDPHMLDTLELRRQQTDRFLGSDGPDLVATKSKSVEAHIRELASQFLKLAS